MSKNIVILSLLFLILALVFLIRYSHEGFITFVEKLEKSAEVIDHKKEDKEVHLKKNEEQDSKVHDNNDSTWEEHNTYFPPKCIKKTFG